MRLRVLKGTCKPRPLLDRLEGEALSLRHPYEQSIERSEEELTRMFDSEELPRARPYWDPRRRTERATRIRFVRRLTGIGLGTYMRSIRGALGMFFLRKTDGRQRMVIGARAPNSMHRRPPGTELSTPGALAGHDLMAEVDDCQNWTEVGRDREQWAESRPNLGQMGWGSAEFAQVWPKQICPEGWCNT